jgi:hypothetical protein
MDRETCGCHAGACEQRAVALSTLRAGQTAVVCAAMTDPSMHADDAAYVRAMGLRPSATVRVCREGQPCIVEVVSGSGEGSACCGTGACRIGLSRELAQRVYVESVAKA